ncbi:carbohydrate sulfotransferase 11-like [Palaemon carinicauda]|uniref:carbohydrate sulfotransferase 11-like n=1 Tax=Palaemon carinicauda TaxID=392227 RepID=UPI0035B5B02C
MEVLRKKQGKNGEFTGVVLDKKEMRMVMAELRHRMRERTSLVNMTCHKYRNKLLHLYAKWLGVEESWQRVDPLLHVNPDILVNRKQRLVWCKVPKVASTSFVHGLLRVTGGGDLIEDKIFSRSNLHIILRRMMPYPRPGEDIGKFIAFMAVRHPFQRILSAYRDKFMDRSEVVQFKKFKELYGLSVIAKYRKSDPPVEYRDIPTFLEFVQYLISTPIWEYNEHWRPYFLTCSACHHRYDAILHLETLQDDSEFLVNITGFRELAPRHVHITRSKSGPEIPAGINVNVSKGNKQSKHKKIKQLDLKKMMHSRHGKVNKNLVDEPLLMHHQEEEDSAFIKNIEAKFFSEITLQHLLELHKIFLIDFEMFGYNLSPYDQYVCD